MENIIVRKIEKKDNLLIAELIRIVFREFKIDMPGTVYTDPTTDSLFELFQQPKSIYWLAEENGQLLGACGIYPTDGLPEGCAELVKFYVSPAARGRGIGRMLMGKSIESARLMNYRQLYLESFPELGKAIGMYEKAGFKPLAQALGSSVHYACTIWMLKDL